MLIWTSPICKDSKLLHIELRLLAYIRLLSGKIQFPSPDGMRASTPFLLRGSREPCGQTGLSTSVQPIRHRLSSLQSWVGQYSFYLFSLPVTRQLCSACSFASIAHAWRAFLCACATTAMLKPRRSSTPRNQRLWGSCLSPKCCTTARAPWINSCRR